MYNIVCHVFGIIPNRSVAIKMLVLRKQITGRKLVNAITCRGTCHANSATRP